MEVSLTNRQYLLRSVRPPDFFSNGNPFLDSAMIYPAGIASISPSSLHFLRKSTKFALFHFLACVLSNADNRWFPLN